MKKKKNFDPIVVMMWSILWLAFLGATGVPDGDKIVIGTPAIEDMPKFLSPYQMTVNDLVYFVSRDIILLVWAHIAWLKTKKLIAGVLVRLAIGKIIDEFVHPFGYWYGEMAWDFTVACWGIYKWMQINREWEQEELHT